MLVADVSAWVSVQLRLVYL